MKAFVLEPTTHHVLPGQDADVFFDEAPKRWYFTMLRELEPRPSGPIQGRVFAPLEGRTDMPLNSAGWPVLSRRAVGALSAVRPFPMSAVPLELSYEGEALPEQYVAVHLREHTPAMDLEASDWDPHELRPSRVGVVRRLVLRAAAGTLPPLFLVEGYSRDLHVSEEGMEALRAIGVLGIDFIEVEVLESSGDTEGSGSAPARS